MALGVLLLLLGLGACGGGSGGSPAPVAPGSGIALSLAPRRVSGVAPLAVFFDATLTSSAGVARPFHDIEYRWSFGDPAGSPVLGTSWSTGSRPAASSRNAAKGPVAAHVFETPGTYTVTLTAFDGSNTAVMTTAITVHDPDTEFAGAETACFSNDADFTGCPPGATQSTTADFRQVTTAAATTNNVRRLLMKRGDVFNVSTQSGSLTAPGPGILGAFGPSTNPLPVVRATNNLTMLQLSSQNTPTTFNDWRVMDIEFDGQGFEAINAIEGSGGGTQWTLLRANIHDAGFCIQEAVSLLDFHNASGSPGHLVWDQRTIQDVTCLRANRYGIFHGARRLAFQGNLFGDLSDGTLTEHIQRLVFANKAVVSNNTYQLNSTNSGHFKFHAVNFGTAGPSAGGPGQFSEQVVVSDNLYRGSARTGNIMAVIAPQNGQSDERLRDILVERNWFRAGTGTDGSLVVNADDVSIRNNLCDTTGAVGSACISVGRYGAEPVHNNVHIFNNTGYNASAVQFTYVFVSGETSNVLIKNNLASGPFSSNGSQLFFSNGGPAVVAQSNYFGAAPGFAGTLSPGVQFNSTADFVASAGRNAGLTLPAVDAPRIFEDFFGAPRPAGNAVDQGATEQ